MAGISTFSTAGLSFFFQSKRAKIDSKAVSQLVKFIRGAKHSLDVAIYDMKNPDVLKALKGMSTKVQLHILYDAGKAGGGSTTVDPKLSTTAQAIKAAGLKAFAQPVKEKGGHLMHDKLLPGLHIVATPIGNLGDLSPRAADTLSRPRDSARHEATHLNA